MFSSSIVPWEIGSRFAERILRTPLLLCFRYLEEMGLAEREAEMQELETSRPGRSRDLFGVQLEVIALKTSFIASPSSCYTTGNHAVYVSHVSNGSRTRI